MADETAIVEDTENPTPPDDDPYGLNRIPEVAKDIGVESKIGDFIDPDSPFHDHDNRFVNLGDYFDGQQPVMLSFNYSNCPKLCSVQLENMVATLAQIKFRVGTDFKMVSIRRQIRVHVQQRGKC
jgi:protein SCO1/2